MPFGLITVFPDPILFEIPGTIIRIGWYGVGYVVAVAVMIWVTQQEAKLSGIDPGHVLNALIVVAVCALVGARLYHVIDQWGACAPGEPCYSQNLPAIILPPYSGLALYGGVAGAIVGIVIYTRRHALPIWTALDICVPGTLFAQGIARWGNFFNQELYGPPTNAPWGITIGCDHRVPQYPCSTYPEATTGFHPLFFYESVLDFTGGFIALYLSRRQFRRLRDGDLASFWFIWYGATRFALESFRLDYDWKILGILPTAMGIGVVAVIFGIATIIWRHSRPEEPEGPEGDEEDVESTGAQPTTGSEAAAA